MKDEGSKRPPASDESAPKKNEASPPRPPPAELRAETRHRARIAGKDLEYTATAGSIFLRDDEGEPRAEIFYVAYTVAGAPESRPVTFCFNGGPGSSSVWLHLGMMGPKRAAFPDPHHPPPPPYRLEDNEGSVLDVTDLVFIDPVGTGLSRVLGKDVKPEQYHSVAGDVESCGEFIRLWITRERRWNSPKMLCGESYGGTRVAGLAPHLSDRGIMLNGVIFVSAALDFSHLDFVTGNDLPYVLFLPSYAATAAYHRALPEKPRDLDAFLVEAREFAIREYAPALLRGHALPEEDRKRIVGELSRFTGISRELLERWELRIDQGRFSKELLRTRGVTVGRLDARFVGHDVDRGAADLGSDPSFSAPHGPYAVLLNDYLRRELGVSEERAYQVLNFKVNESWKWDLPKGRPFGYVTQLSDLRRAMLENPHLRIFFANGLYDLATPFFSNEHCARHLGSEAHVRSNVREATYPAGHMMYLHDDSRRCLREDLVELYRDACGGAR